MSAHASPAAPYPAAELDRRFYAFTLDRLLGWTVIAAGVAVSVMLLLEPGRTAAGVAVIVGVVLLVALAFALLLGLRGTSPGKAALGLRVVDAETGASIGVRRALLRTAVLAVATLPTFGLGVATLAWIAVMDPGGRRRGWHDRRARSVVVDVRPVPVAESEEAPAPRAIVNLTAMRLVPPPAEPERPDAAAPPAPPVPAAPAARPAPSAPGVSVEPAPLDTGTAPTRTRRRQLGHPLLGTPPTAPPPSGPPGSPPTAAPPAPTPPPTPPPPSPPVPTTRWRVSFDTGEAFVVEGLTLVGRRPEGREGEPVHRLVPLRSDDQSLSKTHAQFQVVPDGALVVMDRGSTNGSVLLRRGVARHLSENRPATLLPDDVVRFGDRTMTVARDG
jgi:uncharacterized RDD family membrane protein YckC